MNEDLFREIWRGLLVLYRKMWDGKNMERKLTNGKLMDIIIEKWKENGKGGDYDIIRDERTKKRTRVFL